MRWWGRRWPSPSDRPQTTRHTIRGIVHREDFRSCSSTPRSASPPDAARQAPQRPGARHLFRGRVIGLCIPADEAIGPGDRWIYDQIRAVAPRTTLVVIVTKIQGAEGQRSPRSWIAVNEFAGEHAAEIVPGVGGHRRTDRRADRRAGRAAPPGPAFYPDGELTDEPEEVPSSSARRPWKGARRAAFAGRGHRGGDPREGRSEEQGDDHVHAVLYVERPSQKSSSARVRGSRRSAPPPARRSRSCSAPGSTWIFGSRSRRTGSVIPNSWGGSASGLPSTRQPMVVVSAPEQPGRFTRQNRRQV